MNLQLVSRTGQPDFLDLPWDVPLDELPGGAFALVDGAPHLVLDGRLERWTPAGYAGARLPARGRAATITPPSLVQLLRTGWSPLVPFIHPTAGRR